MDDIEMAAYEQRGVIRPVAGPATIAPEPTVPEDSPRTMEAIVSALERRIEDLLLERQEWEHEREVYQQERAKLLDSFDEQRQKLTTANERIAALTAQPVTDPGGVV